MKLYLLIFLAICIVQCIRAQGVVGPGTPSCPIDLKRLYVKCAFKVFCTSHGECGVTDDGVTKICCPWNCAQRCIDPSSIEYAAGYAALAELDGKK